MTFRESELLGKHKVSHRCPHNLQAVKEIHFIPKQHARKTISKMGPGSHGPIVITRGLPMARLALRFHKIWGELEQSR